MSLDSLLHFISSSGLAHQAEADLAFAEVDGLGRIVSINPFGRLAWGWRAGSDLGEELRFALETLETDQPEELPIKAGGLHLRGMRISNREGWFLIGFEPGRSVEQSQQISFRTLMDRIPQPALSMNTAGLARYVNEAVAQAMQSDASRLMGRPVLAELICPEDRWKLAELLEIAAREGSSHATVRFGREARTGVLHVVQSVADEFQALILPLTGQGHSAPTTLVPEVQYQSFLEQAPVGILHLDARGTVTFENHHFRTLVGQTPDDSWLGLPLEGVRCLDRTEIQELLTAVQDGTSWTGDVALHESGSSRITHHLHVHVSPIHSDSDRIGSALLIEDRTERMRDRQERQLMERNAKVKAALRELATEHPDPTAYRQAATRLLGSTSQASAALILGLSLAKDRLVTVSSWSSDSGIDTDYSFAREYLADMESARFGRFLTPALVDSLRLDTDLDWWIDPLADNEQMAGFVLMGWARDTRDGEWVTSSRLNEWIRLFESLYSGIQTAARYRLTVSAIDDALFGFAFLPDRGRRFHFITDQIELLSGYLPAELMRLGEGGVDWMRDVVHPEDAPLVRAHHRTIQDGHESRVTYRIRHGDGSIRWLQEHATPRAEPSGLLAVNGILSDVSEQKAAELVLLQAKKEAELSDRSKTAFIATMSHEIRTPLGAVNGFAQLLERELDDFEEELPHDLPEQVREFVGAISERSQKLLSLVHDLFELSNVEMGKATLNLSTQESSGLIRQAVERHQPDADRKGLLLRQRMHDPAARIAIDPKRFGQILDNLVSNAIKFTEQGTVDVEQRVVGDYLVIEVRDTGIGIADDYLDRLFEAFSQEENWRNRRYEGTGLGLTLAARLTEMMEGTIEVESAKGIGSTFRVHFPLVKQSASVAARIKGWFPTLDSGRADEGLFGMDMPGGDGHSV